jgi:hypothetical protein
MCGGKKSIVPHTDSVISDSKITQRGLVLIYVSLTFVPTK